MHTILFELSSFSMLRNFNQITIISFDFILLIIVFFSFSFKLEISGQVIHSSVLFLIIILYIYKNIKFYILINFLNNNIL